MGTSGGFVSIPREHPGDFSHAQILIQNLHSGERLSVCHPFDHPQVGRSVGRHLGEVGYDEHLVLIGDVAERSTDGTCRFTADTRINLVKDEGSGATGEHETKREHGPSQFATRCNLGQGKWMGARICCQQEGHLLSSITLHVDGHPRVGHGEGPQMLFSGRGQG